MKQVWDHIAYAWPIVNGRLAIRLPMSDGSEHEPTEENLRAMGTALEQNILGRNLEHKISDGHAHEHERYPALKLLTHYLVISPIEGWEGHREFAVGLTLHSPEEISRIAQQN